MWGSWEWGRCGLPNTFHTEIAAWQALSTVWTSDDAFLNSKGLLRSREEGLGLLLKIALAWAEISTMQQTPFDLQPATLQESILNYSRARLDILRGIEIQTEYLKDALSDIEIPPRPTVARPAFITIAPDLREDMVEAITRLRQTREPLTQTQINARRAHAREAKFRERVLANIAAATKKRSETGQPEPQTEHTQRRKRGKAGPTPMVPVLPLQHSLPQRSAQVETVQEPVETPVITAGGPSKKRSRRSAPRKSTTVAGASSRARGRVSTRGGTSARGRSGARGPSARGRSGARGTSSRRKSTKRRKPESDTDSSDEEDFTELLMDDGGDDDDDEEDDEDDGDDGEGQGGDYGPDNEAPSVPRPRPRPILKIGSVAEIAHRAKRGRDELEGAEGAGAPGTPGTQPGDIGSISAALSEGLSSNYDGPTSADPPSAVEVRSVKRPRHVVEVVLDPPAS